MRLSIIGSLMPSSISTCFPWANSVWTTLKETINSWSLFCLSLLLSWLKSPFWICWLQSWETPSIVWRNLKPSPRLRWRFKSWPTTLVASKMKKPWEKTSSYLFLSTRVTQFKLNGKAVLIWLDQPSGEHRIRF